MLEVERKYMKPFYTLALIQGVYYIITGIWSLVDIDSFIMVTGPKCDIWLVRTVGAMVIPIGVTLLLAAIGKELGIQAIVLAAGSALAFASIDVIYSLNDTIWNIYLADALAQAIFLSGWLLYVFVHGNKMMKGRDHV